MVTRIALGGMELARIRFAVSPVYETVMALAVLHRPGVHAVHVPWVRWARGRLDGLADLDLLLDLVADDHVKPAFLMPPPDARMPGIDRELRLIRGTGADRVRADLDHLRVASARIRRLRDDPPGQLPAIVAALRACHDRLVAPHWTRMSRILEADISHRGGRLAEGGIESLFADLHDEVRLTEGELVVHPDRARGDDALVRLGGHGLVLCPSVFCWPRVTVGRRPVGLGTLRYPARGVARLWERAEPAPDAVAALIGRTRAELLVALARPATTTDLAGLLHVTPGAVSQHLGVLRAAGLVSTHRDGRTVLHLRTGRADALLG